MGFPAGKLTDDMWKKRCFYSILLQIKASIFALAHIAVMVWIF